MFSEYIESALRRAKYETLENGTYMATVDGLRGVIATGETIETCRVDLIEPTSRTSLSLGIVFFTS